MDFKVKHIFSAAALILAVSCPLASQAVPVSGTPYPAALSQAALRGADMVKADATISNLVFSQELKLLEAGKVVEDCLYGRVNFKIARNLVQKCLSQGEKYNAEIKNYNSKHPTELGNAALQLWTKRRAILSKMDKLLAAGKIERSALSGFQQENGELTQAVVVNWLGAKAALAKAGLTEAPDNRAKSYYEWQNLAVPAQKQMCIHNQRLLELSASAANGKRISVQEIKEIQASLQGLGNKLKTQRVAGHVQGAHKALIAEITALGRLAEAMILLGQDQSADASSRVERCNKNLRKASLRSEQAALDSLKSLVTSAS